MIHVPSSEVRHFYKLIRDGDLSESEFGDVWNDSIRRAIEAARQKEVIMDKFFDACRKFISQIHPSGDVREYDIDPQHLKEFCDALEAAQQLRAADAIYCVKCGDEILPICGDCNGEN